MSLKLPLFMCFIPKYSTHLTGDIDTHREHLLYLLLVLSTVISCVLYELSVLLYYYCLIMLNCLGMSQYAFCVHAMVLMCTVCNYKYM